MRSLSGWAAVAFLVGLSACGGGGLPSDSGSTPALAVPDAGNLVASVPASTYGVGSLQASAFDALNAVRLASGAGAVAQSAQIDVAAAAHANFVQTHMRVLRDWHNQDLTLPGFYETTPTSRAQKAGFASDWVGEAIGGVGPTRVGAEAIYGLLASVYDGASVLMPATHVGLGHGVDVADFPFIVMNQASPSGSRFVQVPAAGKVVAYPFAGQTNSYGTFCVDCESPRIPEAVIPKNFSYNSLYTLTGAPILVSVRNADFVNSQEAATLDVKVTKFEIRDAANLTLPAAFLFHPTVKASGFNAHVDSRLLEGFAALVPLAPLAANASYTVTFVATLKAGGLPLTKTWSFRTRPSAW